MKNQKEIYEALLAGETLVLDGKHKVILKGGYLCDPVTGDPVIGYQFDSPSFWQIYKEPKWYENIPEGGVLCWNKSGSQFDVVRVTSYEPDNMYSWRTGSGGFDGNPKPLTLQEISVFVTNAPEEL